MKETFIKLNPEKKTRIEDAILNEFKEHPLNKASVKNIIEKAQIPRGSFYQYFDDIEEAYFYILNKYTKDTHLIFIEIMKEGKSFQEVLKEYGRAIADEVFDENKISLYKYRFLFWNDSLERGYRDFSLRENSSDIKMVVPSEMLEDKEKGMFIKAIVHDLIRRAFNEQWNKEKFIEIYSIHCAWIMGGI